MKQSNKGFDYSYNAQAVVDSAEQIIVAAETTNEGKYSVNPSPALAFSRSGGYSRPLWTTDQPPCSVSRPCESQSRNWHPSPLVRHRIPRHRNPFVPPRLSPSAPVRFARG